MPVKAELCFGHVVTVDVYDGDHKAFRRVLSVFMDSEHVIFEGNRGNFLGVENRNTVEALALN